MINIFEKLQKPEIFRVAEVCHDWLSISKSSTIINRITVKISDSNSNEAVDFFIEHEITRKFNFSLKLFVNLPDKFLEFANKFSENIIDLELIDIKLFNYYDFIAKLTKLTNLRNLKLDSCLFKHDDSLIIAPADDLYFNLTTLDLTLVYSNYQMEVAHLLSIINILKIFKCSSFKMNVQRTIIDSLKKPKLTKSIKEISFYDFDSTVLSPFFQIKNFNLEKFVLTCYGKIDCLSDLERFLLSQKNLKILALDYGPSVRTIVSICSKVYLEQLTFDFNDEIIDDSEILAVLWKLKYLKITSCNRSIFKSLIKNSETEEFTLTYYDGDMSLHKDKFEYMTNLTSFRIEYSVINDDLIQAIFKYLIQLRDLFLIDNEEESVINYI